MAKVPSESKAGTSGSGSAPDPPATVRGAGPSPPPAAVIRAASCATVGAASRSRRLSRTPSRSSQAASIRVPSSE